MDRDEVEAQAEAQDLVKAKPKLEPYVKVMAEAHIRYVIKAQAKAKAYGTHADLLDTSLLEGLFTLYFQFALLNGHSFSCFIALMLNYTDHSRE